MVLFILIAILVFSVLIAVHELGHFLAAKASGVKVNEFSIGMGPAWLKRQKGETLYALRILPIGGYCAMEGEDEESEDERAFTSQSWWKRLIVLVAGSFMNFLTGFIIILVLFSSAAGFYTTTVDSFAQESDVSPRTGIEEGDRIVSVDGERIYITSDFYTIFSRVDSERVDVVIERQGEKMTLENVPISYGDVQQMQFGVEKATFGARLKNAWYNSVDFVRLVRISLVDLFKGAVSVKDLSGPIGIVDVMTEVGTSAATKTIAAQNIAYLAAFIAINLAVMNMLPIPALDGGRVFFLLVTTVIEKIRRKKVNPKYEGYVHMAGLVFFLGLMVFVAFNDIVKLIG